MGTFLAFRKCGQIQRFVPGFSFLVFFLFILFRFVFNSSGLPSIHPPIECLTFDLSDVYFSETAEICKILIESN